MGNNEKSDRSKHADTVIRNHVIWSMGASFIPWPVADILAVSALQLDMIRQLCRVYDKDFSESQGKAIVTALTSSTLAKAGGVAVGSLIKVIPIVGTFIGGITVSIFNGASSYALGEVFKKHFDSGGTILDFDTERLKKVYQEKFEKGKKVAQQLKKDKMAQQEAEAVARERHEAGDDPIPMETTNTTKKKDSNSVVEKLKELAELKNQGILSEEEFQQMKQKIIDSFNS